jgi:hypothetical protein
MPITVSPIYVVDNYLPIPIRAYACMMQKAVSTYDRMVSTTEFDVLTTMRK